jgi:hypothetical protein
MTELPHRLRKGAIANRVAPPVLRQFAWQRRCGGAACPPGGIVRQGTRYLLVLSEEISLATAPKHGESNHQAVSPNRSRSHLTVDCLTASPSRKGWGTFRPHLFGCRAEEVISRGARCTVDPVIKSTACQPSPCRARDILGRDKSKSTPASHQARTGSQVGILSRLGPAQGCTSNPLAPSSTLRRKMVGVLRLPPGPPSLSAPLCVISFTRIWRNGTFGFSG